ncbi:hypothetical protein ACH4A5_16810, partial [Streptomyces lydicus]
AMGRPLGDPLTGHAGAVLTVATAQIDDRPIAITGSQDCTIRIWDLAATSCLMALRLPHVPACATIASDGTVVVGMSHEVIALTLAPTLLRRES